MLFPIYSTGEYCVLDTRGCGTSKYSPVTRNQPTPGHIRILFLPFAIVLLSARASAMTDVSVRDRDYLAC